MVQTIMVVRITIKAISGKTCESGTPAVRGNDANTAAARPRGYITVIKVSSLRNSDFKVDILTAKKRIPRKAKAKNRPKNSDVNDDKLNKRPVKTKKKERIRKLIWQ